MVIKAMPSTYWKFVVEVPSSEKSSLCTFKLEVPDEAVGEFGAIQNTLVEEIQTAGTRTDPKRHCSELEFTKLLPVTETGVVDAVNPLLGLTAVVAMCW